jgi:hypothetical protein
MWLAACVQTQHCCGASGPTCARACQPSCASLQAVRCTNGQLFWDAFGGLIVCRWFCSASDAESAYTLETSVELDDKHHQLQLLSLRLCGGVLCIKRAGHNAA